MKMGVLGKEVVGEATPAVVAAALAAVEEVTKPVAKRKQKTETVEEEKATELRNKQDSQLKKEQERQRLINRFVLLFCGVPFFCYLLTHTISKSREETKEART